MNELSSKVQISNLSHKMHDILQVNTLNLLKKTAETADILKAKVYLTGGFVRDILIGFQSKDIDLVVEGDAIDLAAALAEEIKAKTKIYKRFKTVKVILPDKLIIDFATARNEKYEFPAALPVVKPGLLVHDLKRRDFSVNAIAVSLNKKNFGQVIDPFNGRIDINKKIIRVLHNQSFIDDPTRIFRAIRFEQRLGFSIDKQTQDLIQEAISKKMLEELSGYRIAKELKLNSEEKQYKQINKRITQLIGFDFVHKT